MNNPNSISMPKHRLVSWLVVCAFLVLGFCPLRNTLLDLAHPGVKAPKVPVYSKITGQDDCITVTIQKAIPASGKSLAPPLLLASLLAAGFIALNAGFAVKANNSLLLLSPGRCSSFPIYLRNRCLLI